MRKLELRIEKPVIDGADLDPQPPAVHRAIGGAETRHASWHRP
jgi:hypothetical protein